MHSGAVNVANERQFRKAKAIGDLVEGTPEVRRNSFSLPMSQNTSYLISTLPDQIRARIPANMVPWVSHKLRVTMGMFLIPAAQGRGRRPRTVVTKQKAAYISDRIVGLAVWRKRETVTLARGTVEHFGLLFNEGAGSCLYRRVCSRADGTGESKSHLLSEQA